MRANRERRRAVLYRVSCRAFTIYNVSTSIGIKVADDTGFPAVRMSYSFK